MDFSFYCPTEIVFGRGKVYECGSLLKSRGASKVMLVADSGVRKTGICDLISDVILKEGIDIIQFDQIVANPRKRDCEAGAKLGLEEKIDYLVAVGGGSSMDTAKAIAGMIGHSTSDFSTIQYPNAYTKKQLPLLCVPTTAGTGSEMSTCGVITDEETKTKVFCFDPLCHADIALCDPDVLKGLPNMLAASTALDALTHAIEGYVAKCTSAVTECFGIRAVRLIAENIREYVYQRTPESCEAIMLGSIFAGLSFGYSDTCAVHSISETIGGLYDTPHGIANAIFLADVTEYSIPADEDKYMQIAEAFGISNTGNTKREMCQKLVEEIRTLVKDLAIPGFSDIDGVKVEDFDLIAKRCENHLSAPDNPREMKKEDFLKILKTVYYEEN